MATTVYKRAVFSTTAQEPREIGREILLNAAAHAEVFRSTYAQYPELVEYGDVVYVGTRQVRENAAMVTRFVYEKVWLLADLPNGGTAINRRDIKPGAEVRVVAGGKQS